jgi:hypothetical protein
MAADQWSERGKAISQGSRKPVNSPQTCLAIRAKSIMLNAKTISSKIYADCYAKMKKADMPKPVIPCVSI